MKSNGLARLVCGEDHQAGGGPMHGLVGVEQTVPSQEIERLREPRAAAPRGQVHGRAALIIDGALGERAVEDGRLVDDVGVDVVFNDGEEAQGVGRDEGADHIVVQLVLDGVPGPSEKAQRSQSAPKGAPTRSTEDSTKIGAAAAVAAAGANTRGGGSGAEMKWRGRDALHGDEPVRVTRRRRGDVRLEDERNHIRRSRLRSRARARISLPLRPVPTAV